MEELYTYLKEHPVLYITRQAERADSLSTAGYEIFSDESRSTRELLTDPRVAELFANKPEKNLVIFKTNRQAEQVCKLNNWNLLNPSADLAERVEAKISQTKWLGELANLLVPFAIRRCSELVYDGTPVIVQFNHSHSGLGTILQDSEAQVRELATDFPDRPVRISKFIDGPVFTSNNVVTGTRVILGSLSYQITGLPAFTDNPFATIGNDWGIVNKLLTAEQQRKAREISTKIGERMQRDGWRGCYGVDLILDKNTDELYLIEVNARQTASVTFESMLQKSLVPELPTTFESHIASLANIPFESSPAMITAGARLIRRQSSVAIAEDAVGKLQVLGLSTVESVPEKPGEDLLQIRSNSVSLMAGHNKLSPLGEEVAKLVS